MHVFNYSNPTSSFLLSSFFFLLSFLFSFSPSCSLCISGGYSVSSSHSNHPTPPTVNTHNTLLSLREREKEKERVRALQQLLDAQSDNTLTEFVEEDYVEIEKVQLQL